MSIFFEGENLAIIISPKSIYFDLSIGVNKSLEYEIKFIVTHNESLT